MQSSSLLNYKNHQYDKIHIIQNIDIHTGFSALIIYVLNGIRKAVENNHLPVVIIDKRNTAHFYDKERGENIWEYFFLPINNVTHDQIENDVKKGLLSQESIYIPTADEVMNWHQHDEQRLATFWAWEEPVDKQQWLNEKRALGRFYIKEYIQVKPDILEKANSLCNQLFSAPYTIGIHIRGTDFTYATVHSIEKYFHEIDRIVEEKELSTFNLFIATDQQQYIEQFEIRYPQKVVYTNAIRSTNHIAPFRFQNEDSFKKGEDVLIDILLLSRCDHIIKGASAVGEIALWFNDKATCTDFALKSEFIKKKYTSLNSAYSRLDIDKKGSLWVKVHQFKEACWKSLESSYRLRFLYKFLLSLKRI